MARWTDHRTEMIYESIDINNMYCKVMNSLDKAAQAKILQFQLGEVETDCGEQNSWEEPWRQVMYN